MAKKQEQVTSEPSVSIQVSYDDLMASKVQVVGREGVFYLDPGKHLGEFVLRAVPQAQAESEVEIPDAWRKRTVEEEKAANPKIDWDVPGTVEEATDKDEEAVG